MIKVTRDGSSYIVTRHKCKPVRLRERPSHILCDLIDGKSPQVIAEEHNLDISNIIVLKNKFADLGFLKNDPHRHKPFALAIEYDIYSRNFSLSSIGKYFILKLTQNYPTLLMIMILVSLYLIMIVVDYRSIYYELGFAENLVLYILVLLSILIHECGHIIAGVAYEAKASFLGVALRYGFIPVAYIENNEIYHLSSLQRMAVHFGGVFFCALYVVFLMLLWKAVHLTIFLVAAKAVAFIQIFNLLPLYGLDGYKILKETPKVSYFIDKKEKFIQWITRLIFCASFIYFIIRIAVRTYGNYT